MERFFKRKPSCPSTNTTTSTPIPSTNATTSTPTPTTNATTRKVDVDNLPSDPFDRLNILNYDPNQRDEIRRLYWLRGPCQPHGHVFPTKKIGSKVRRFFPRGLMSSVG